jgi:RNA ligase (TIGR02306 family)
VVGKDMYKTGDVVVFAPKRSIIPTSLRAYYTNEETGESYLQGPNKDRIGSIRLRGEESEGAILPIEWVREHLRGDFPFPGEDISEALGITEHVPGNPGTPGTKSYSSQGDIVQNAKDVVEMQRFVRHGVEQYGIFKNEFVLGEPVVATEKIHGSQISIMKDRYGKVAVTSKGRAEKNLVLRKYPVSKPFSGRGFCNKVKSTLKWILNVEGPINEYWKVAIDTGIIDFINEEQFCGKEVQIFGEVIPFQKGFGYGFNNLQKRVFIFRLVIGTVDQPYGCLDNLNWVPLLYEGPYDPEKILPLANGMETISGHELHIREGLVLTPKVFRKTVKGVPLLVKILNKKYKSNDEDPV